MLPLPLPLVCFFASLWRRVASLPTAYFARKRNGKARRNKTAWILVTSSIGWEELLPKLLRSLDPFGQAVERILVLLLSQQIFTQFSFLKELLLENQKTYDKKVKEMEKSPKGFGNKSLMIKKTN